MIERALVVGCLSLWELWEGNLGWLLGTLKDMWKRLWRWASLSLTEAPLWGT
jgi:hypothetical protein